MKNTILILEDNSERTEVMKQWLQDRLYMFRHEFFDMPKPLIERLNAISADVLVIALDHDLNDVVDNPADATGMDVVEYLIQKSPAFPVLVHSTNTLAASRMVKKLKKNHWQVERVIPFDDTTWIGTEWLPALRQLIESNYAERAIPQLSN